MDEEYFPRGGSSSDGEKRKITGKRKNPFSDVTGDTEKRKTGKKDGKTRVSKNTKYKSNENTTLEITTNAAINLDPWALMADLAVLGCIRAVHDFELVVSLPNGVEGYVEATEISDAYTKLLQRLAVGKMEQEEVHSLHELFEVGDVLRCQVSSVIESGGKRPKAKLTINPKVINRAYKVAKLEPGMVFSGIVSSVEDHGYVVDVGVKGAKAFLKTSNAESYIQEYRNGEKLHVGSYITCTIAEKPSKENRAVDIEINPKKMYHTPMADDSDITVDTLLPGMLFDTTIDKIETGGLVVNFLRYSGNIPMSHLNMSATKLEEGKKLRACVLFINPVTKAVTLTTLPHLVTPDKGPKNPLAELEIGTIIEDAKVMKVDNKKGVTLRLPNHPVRALAAKFNLSDQKIVDPASVFNKGDLVKCRIVGFCHADRIAYVSLKESVFTKNLLRIKDVHPAMVIKGTVKGLFDKGMAVELTQHLQAFVPTLHLADVPLRNPQKHYKIGNPVKVKVLTVDLGKRQIIATCKKSMVQSKLPSVSSFDDLEVGMTTDGFIAKITDGGVLVSLYDNVKGFVPKRYLSEDFIAHPERVFFYGQVVKCHVVNFSPVDKRITLSLIVPGRTPFGRKELELPKDFVVGGVTHCQITKKTEKGFDVKLPSKLPAFLPKMHLSDHVSHCDIMHSVYQVGQKLEKVVYLSSKNVITVSMKQSLINSSEAGNFIKEFEDLQPGQLVNGMVKKFMDYGAFVDLYNGMMGLVPNKFLCDRRVNIPSSLYREGQSVEAKVMELDSEKKRVLLSLRMVDCYHGNTSIGVTLAKKAVEQMDAIAKVCQGSEGVLGQLAQLHMGQAVKVIIDEINELGALVHVKDSEIRGVCITAHFGDIVPKVGHELEAVILYADLTDCCIEVSLDKEHIKRTKKRVDNKFSQVQPGQVIKSEVLLVKNEFVLVMLRGHALGKLAYLPSRRHLNDVLEQYQYKIGQVNPIIVKLVKDDLIYGSLQIHENQSSDIDGKTSVAGVSIGDVVKAHITARLPWQLNVKIDKLRGRIHVTEVVDELEEEGTNPLDKFAPNTEVQGRVIDFRPTKGRVQKSLSKPGRSTDLAEVSIKKSVFDMENPSGQKPFFRPGEPVNFFVKECTPKMVTGMIGPKSDAKICLLDLSKDLKVIQDPEKHFKETCGYKGRIVKKDKQGKWLVTLLGENTMKEGALVNGAVASVNKERGLQLHLPNNMHGHVCLTDISDDWQEDWYSNYKLDDIVRCRILKFTSAYRCLVSLRTSRLSKKKSSKIVDPEIESVGDLEEGALLKGFISTCNKTGVYIRLSRDIIGRAQYRHVAKGYVESSEDILPAARLVTVKVIGINKEKNLVDLSMLEEDTGLDPGITAKVKKSLKRKRKAEEMDKEEEEEEGEKEEEEGDVGAPVKRKKEAKVEEKTKKKEKEKEKKKMIEKETKMKIQDSAVDSDSEDEVKIVHTSKDPSAPRLSLSSSFSLETTFKGPATTLDRQQDSSSDEDSDEEGDKKQKSKNQANKRKFKKAEEKMIRQREEMLLDKDRTPETVEDFERMVLESPDSSIVWLRYMAFYLETAEVEKARAIAERSLKTISFREEQEKMNVWVAYLNLENMYGNEAQLQGVFERALQHNEPIVVYQQLANIYATSDKTEAAESLYRQMTKKFSLNKDVWIKFGQFYFHAGKPDMARKLMHRSLLSLNKKDHIEVLSKFAQMEFKSGEPERGKTMFENVLSTYPKRNDLWIVYIDLLIKTGDISAVRQVFERVISTKMSVKKMKTFFKKYLEFEEKYGSDSSVEEVKQKALDYVEAKVDIS